MDSTPDTFPDLRKLLGILSNPFEERKCWAVSRGGFPEP
jgi:hypothetical protein